MPCHSVTLPGIEQTVARPVIFSIVNQIFDITNLSKETAIYYAGQAGSVKTPGTSIDEVSRDAKFPSGRYTFVEVTEGYDQGTLQETFVNAEEHRPVWQDPKLRVSIRPVYLTSNVKIQLRYRSNSESEVKRWAAEMFMKISRGRDINLHTVKYSYPFPLRFIELLEDIWTLREAVDGYGDSFMNYLTRHGCDRLTIQATQTGGMRQLAVKETQSRIQGLFDLSVLPEQPEKNNDTGTWEIAIPYTFSYQRPEAAFVEYPISVHNQFIPEKYFLEKNEDDYDDRRHYYSDSYEMLSAFESDTTSKEVRPAYPFIRIPSFDEFYPSRPYPGSSTIATVLCFLDEGKQDLVSLKDLGDYVIDPDLIEFITSERPYLLKMYCSFFYISVDKDGVTQPNDLYEVTPDLMVRAKAPLDRRCRYHVRIAVIADPEVLVWDAIDRLSNYPKAFVKLLKAINELLRLDPDFNLERHGGPIKEWELNYVYWILTGKKSVNNKSYFDGIIGFPDGRPNYGLKDARNPFVNINDEMVQRYLRYKRFNGLTVQITGIIARSINTLKPTDEDSLLMVHG